jgi:hypothetical protein
MVHVSSQKLLAQQTLFFSTTNMQVRRDTNTRDHSFCFIPIIPFSLKPDKDVGCHICKFYQDLKHRPDVQNMMESGGGAGGQQIPMQGGPPQGWTNGGQQQPQYAQGGQPQYK